MKKLLLILAALLPIVVSAQQFPYLDSYQLNPFSFSPVYAGLDHGKTLFMDYRSDWSGIDGGPRTYQLSYSDKFRNRVGLGMRFVYDKADIFKQTLVLGTYTYEVSINGSHKLNFGLSTGIYRNTLDLSKYFNDPGYSDDLALIYGQQKSLLKFATDISALYRYKNLETGLVFSNIMFGVVKYRNTDLTYKPFKNYTFHAAMNFSLDDKWTIKPVVIVRGGKNVPYQYEVAQTLRYNKRIWLTTLYRTNGVIGLGIGGEVLSGILLNYSYDMNSSMAPGIAFNAYGSHQVTLGVRLFREQKIEQK